MAEVSAHRVYDDEQSSDKQNGIHRHGYKSSGEHTFVIIVISFGIVSRCTVVWHGWNDLHNFLIFSLFPPSHSSTNNDIVVKSPLFLSARIIHELSNLWPRINSIRKKALFFQIKSSFSFAGQYRMLCGK